MIDGVNAGVYVALVVLAYLLGAIPVALVLGKGARGIDIRDWGSGNIGAANAQRTLGWWASAVVFLADIAKAVLPVLMARWVRQMPVVEVACGLAAIIGHNWSPYIGWKGGRGVSSGFGLVLFFFPLAALAALIVGVGVIARTRYVSLGSVVGAGAVVAFSLAYALVLGAPTEYVVFAFAAGGLIVFQHRANIRRLLAGTEHKIGGRAKRLSGKTSSG